MNFFNLIFHYVKKCCCFCECCDCLRSKQLDTNDLDGIARHLTRAKNVIVITGAGISTNAKIPDFRSKSFGLYNRLEKFKLSHPTDVFTLECFKRDPRPFYEIAHDLYPILAEAKPTIAHYFIQLLNNKGKLLRHYTQNIDCLEDLTGLDQDKTVQAHGHIRSGTCLECKKKFSFEYMKAYVIDSQIPICDKCSGTIKPDIVLFGEGLPYSFGKYLVDFPKCDLLIIMGTSLVVQPFAGLAGKVGYSTPRLLINRDPVGDANMFGRLATWIFGLDPNFDTDSMNSRDVFYQGDCDEGCSELAELMGWEQDLNDLIKKE